MKKLFVILLTLCLCLGGCTAAVDETVAPTETMSDEKRTFAATILSINEKQATVQPVDDSLGSDEITFGIADLEDIGAVLRTPVLITYTGEVMESYPAQINAISWSVLENDLRDYDYNGEWLDKNIARYEENGECTGVLITRIYADCFFARYINFPEEYKFNGNLSEEWCVGDAVDCTYEDRYYDDRNRRYEADFLSVKESETSAVFDDSMVCYKPVIYLYPECETEVSVSLTPDGELTCTYPVYGDGWTVTASPDGTLTDKSGQIYNYLYWEGDANADFDLSRGFCVKGEDTAAFLEAALERLGLNRREANEFIVYWLPLMEVNPYNIISFQTDIYTEAAKLDVVPAPDTLIRVFMAWRSSDEFVAVPEQTLVSPEREGFTVIEWGGTEVK